MKSTQLNRILIIGAVLAIIVLAIFTGWVAAW